MGAPLDGQTPSEPLATAPQLKTCSSLACSLLHPLKAWSLRQTRGGSDRDSQDDRISSVSARGIWGRGPGRLVARTGRLILRGPGRTPMAATLQSPHTG